MKKLFLGAMLFLSFGAWAQKKAKLDPATAQINANKETAINALNSAYDADKKQLCKFGILQKLVTKK